MGKFANRLAKEQDPVTHIKRQLAADHQRYPDQEVKFLSNAPLQADIEGYFGGKPAATPELDDLEAFQSSAKGGFAVRKTTQLPNLTNLISGDYFGKEGLNQVDEEFEGASQDGNASDYDDDDGIDPLHAMMARQDGQAVSSDYDRLDTGQLHVMDNHFKEWADLADENLPLQEVTGEGSPAKEAARAAAVGGMDPNWRTTPTRNLRDLEQLPFAGRRGAQRMLAGFGVRPGETTRERSTPENIDQGIARAKLGRARAQFNATAAPLQRLMGPEHAGTPSAVPMARAELNKQAKAEQLNAREQAIKLANARSDDPAGLEGRRLTSGKDAAGWMNYTPLNLAKDRRGEQTATPIAEVSEDQEDDSLTKALVPDYFANKPEEDVAPPPAYDAAQAEADQVAWGGMSFDQEKASNALRNPKKAKLYARMAEAKAQREAAPPEPQRAPVPAPRRPGPGLFSRIGGALSKAAGVVGNAISSAGRGIASLFGFGSRRGAPVTSTFNRNERAQEARVMARDDRPDYVPPPEVEEKPELKYGRLLDANYAKARENWLNFAIPYRDAASQRERERQEGYREQERRENDAKFALENETKPERALRMANERGDVNVGQFKQYDSEEKFVGMPEITEDRFLDQEAKDKKAEEREKQQQQHRAMLELEAQMREKERAEKERKLKAYENLRYQRDKDDAAEALQGGADHAEALHPSAFTSLSFSHFAADASAGASVQGSPSTSQSALIQESIPPQVESKPVAKSEAPVSEPNVAAAPKGVINLPKNAASKAKLVGPQVTAADRAEGARMLNANNAKIEENEANNKKFGYKAKKLFGMVQDQRIDPEYSGKSEREAAEIAMQARLAQEERRKATKKKRLFG